VCTYGKGPGPLATDPKAARQLRDAAWSVEVARLGRRVYNPGPVAGTRSHCWLLLPASQATRVAQVSTQASAALDAPVVMPYTETASATRKGHQINLGLRFSRRNLHNTTTAFDWRVQHVEGTLRPRASPAACNCKCIVMQCATQRPRAALPSPPVPDPVQAVGVTTVAPGQ
jgi:hypothetical protein